MILSHALSLGSKEVIALSGGGGKTTLMFRLAAELAASGQRVVTTMTTRIFVSQMAQAPHTLVLHGEGALLAQLPEALAEYGHVLIAGSTMVEQDKVQGVPPEFLDRIAAQPAVDVVIVEADGSRRLPFKAPAQHEPVIPSQHDSARAGRRPGRGGEAPHRRAGAPARDRCRTLRRDIGRSRHAGDDRGRVLAHRRGRREGLATPAPGSCRFSTRPRTRRRWRQRDRSPGCCWPIRSWIVRSLARRRHPIP